LADRTEFAYPQLVPLNFSLQRMEWLPRGPSMIAYVDVGQGAEPAVGYAAYAPTLLQPPGGEIKTAAKRAPATPVCPLRIVEAPPAPMIIVQEEVKDGLGAVKYEAVRLACGCWSDAWHLGSGATAAVYRAELSSYGVVAVKRFGKTAVVGGAAWRAHYQRELETLRELRHPNILELLACCDDGPDLCLITPFMEGGSLDRAIGGMTWYVRVDVASQLARALVFLHEKKLLHRDVKSSNVLLDKGWHRIRLADFGLACGDSVSTTASTGVVGTLAYMAPELLRYRPYSQETDTFAFAVVLLELLTGLPPVDPGSHPEEPLLCERVAGILDESCSLPPDDDASGRSSASGAALVKKLASRCWREPAGLHFATTAIAGLVPNPSVRPTVAELDTSDDFRAAAALAQKAAANARAAGS